MTPSLITIPVPPNMPHRDWRFILCVAAMKANYGSITECAKAWGVSKQAIYGVLGGYNASAPLEERMAVLTGHPKSVLFPKRPA